MAEAAARRMPAEAQLAAARAHLTEDTHAEILVRLPAKSVFRFRAVCKAWRRIASDPRFLAALSRRQQAEVVLYKYLYLYEAPSEDRWVDHSVDVVLDALPASADEADRRRLIRYPKTSAWLLLASCDGVLLFKKEEGTYLLCNPATRQWAQLPFLPQANPNHYVISDREFAFYFHDMSGEYRLLCRRNLSANGTWCILSTGAVEPRLVDTHAAEADGITELLPCLRTTVSTPVSLLGRLHWPPHQGSVTGQTEMVVFDTVSETFHLMAGPPTTTGTLVKLFDMDGLLVAADFGKENQIDLWFLEGYGARRWELWHQVPVPWGYGSSGRPNEPSKLLSVAAAGDREGNVMLGNHLGLVAYNVRRKTVRTINSVATSDNNVLVSRHVFKANLVQHRCFGVRPSDELLFDHFQC